MSFSQLLPIINSTGLVGLSLFAAYAFVRGYIRPGSDLEKARQDLEDMRKDRDDWKAIAQRGTDQLGQLAQVAQLFKQLQGGGHGQ